MTSLKPCPFCGDEHPAIVRGDEQQFYVACGGLDCFCCIGGAYDRDAMPDHIFRSEEDAAAAWNTRALSAAHSSGGDWELLDQMAAAASEVYNAIGGWSMAPWPNATQEQRDTWRATMEAALKVQRAALAQGEGGEKA